MIERMYSGFQFNDANYDYTNTNTAGSSQQLLNFYHRKPCQHGKKRFSNKGASSAIYAKTPFNSKGMKRIGNLYQQIYSLENLYLADQKARKGKRYRYGVQLHLKNWEANLQALSIMLEKRTYKTSPYTIFTIYEPKEREIFRLPYYPDHITHYAIMNILEPIFIRMFTSDTYSCIKKRGIHGAQKKLTKALQNVQDTKYCLKLDIRKFYPSINHRILKGILNRKFKDEGLLWLLNEIIDSAPGLPIGNYLSQYFANIYLTGFDHWIKETKQVQYYFRYADDIVILAGDKPFLHQLLFDIRTYLQEKLDLKIKSNYQVFPVDQRGIDFVGYIFFHSHVLLRKSIKKNFARMIARRKNKASIASYMGWAVHCNSNHLLKKLLHESI